LIAIRTSGSGACVGDFFFRPSRARLLFAIRTHGLRRGLNSFAAPRLVHRRWSSVVLRPSQSRFSLFASRYSLNPSTTEDTEFTEEKPQNAVRCAIRCSLKNVLRPWSFVLCERRSLLAIRLCYPNPTLAKSPRAASVALREFLRRQPVKLSG